MNSLVEILRENCTIGVAGMCKNAGKTTVVNYIIDEFKSLCILGISSIGYDGEDRDEITKLKKPRVEVFPDMLIATCESCLKKSTAGYKKIANTGIRTALGEVFIVKIKAQGIMEIAGPSMVTQIEVLMGEMKKAGAEKIIIDGSAGRTSFASRVDCTILSVGAALSNDMNKVVRQAKHQVDVFNLEQCENSYAIKFSGKTPYAVLKDEDEVQIIFRGAMVDEDLLDIIAKYKGYKKMVVVNDASSVFITPRIYKKFEHKDGRICVQNKTNLVAVTINPMTPYGKWFDKDKFKKSLQEQINLPTFNILDEKE